MSEPIRAVMVLIWDSLGDRRRFLQAAKENGANTIRIFVDYGVGGVMRMNPVHPFKLIGTWNPYAQAGADGRPDVPQFDLTQKEDACWAALEEILAECGRLGLAVWADFRDHGSEPDEDWRRYLFSFYGNVQMWPGWQTPGYYSGGLEPAHAGGGIGPGLDGYHREFYLWFRDACLRNGVKRILGSPMNECGWPEAPACKLADQVRWIKAQAEALDDLGYEVVISTGYTLTAQVVADARVPIDFWDQHAVIEATDIPSLPFPDNQVIYNTDGAWNGAGPGTSCPPFEKHDASPEQMRALGAEAVRRRAAGVCFLSQQQIWSPDDPWNVDLVDMRPVRAMAEGLGWTPPAPPVEYVRVKLCTLTYKVANAYCPAMFEESFVKGTEPTTPCAYHTAPVPLPESCWKQFMADRPIRKWRVGKFIRCVLGI